MEQLVVDGFFILQKSLLLVVVVEEVPVASVVDLEVQVVEEEVAADRTDQDEAKALVEELLVLMLAQVAEEEEDQEEDRTTTLVEVEVVVEAGAEVDILVEEVNSKAPEVEEEGVAHKFINPDESQFSLFIFKFLPIYSFIHSVQSNRIGLMK